MKPNPSFLQRLARRFRMFPLVAPCLLVATSHAANPSITGIPNSSTVSISDARATNLFAAAVVNEGDTNVLTVYVDFAPAGLGGLDPLPPGVVATATNYQIAANSGAAATTVLGQLKFTPVANLIPVPGTSNVVFHAYVVDAAGNSSSPQKTITVAITATNDALTLAASGTTNITDQQTAMPFQNVVITDPDDGGSQPQTATVNLVGANHGYILVGGTGFVSNNLAYVFSGTPTQVAGALNGLVYVPAVNFYPPGQTDAATFSLRVSDGYVTRTNTSVQVNVYSTNDLPVLAVSGSKTITDKQTVQPFANVAVTDGDESGLQTQAVVITLSAPGNGYLEVGSSGFVSNSLAYTFTNTPAQVTAAISNLVFVPFENLLPVGQSNTTAFTIRVSDGFAAVTNSAVQVVAVSTNDIPQLTGVTGAHFAVETGHSLSPFSVLTFIDPDRSDDTNNPDGQGLNWQVTLTGTNAAWGNLASGGTLVGTSFAGSNGPAPATFGLRDLSYVAPTLTVIGTNTMTLAITADDGHGGTLATNVYVDVYSHVLPPGLSGTQSGQTVYDNSSIAPFSKVKVQSFNGSTVTLKIQLAGGATNDAQGQFINLGSFTKSTVSGAPSLYQFSGTSEAATAAIEALLFQPAANRINGNTTDTAVFGLTLIDGPFTNAPDYSTTVIIVPVNDAPTIAGVAPLVTIQDNQTLAPFSTVLIGDVDEGGQQTVSATITLDVAAKGAFSTNSLAASGFTNTGSGYKFTGTPASLTAAIRQLVFVPTPNRVAVGLFETTIFTIVLNDAHGGIVANNGTAVRVASVSGIPVVNVPTPQPVSIPLSTNIHPFQSVTVSDANPLNVGLRINNPAQGTFTAASVSAAGFADVGGGNYYLSAAASNVTAALQQLVFTADTNLAYGSVINFTLSVTNSLANFVVVNHAMILRTVRNSYIVTKLSDYDPAANVAANLKEGTLRKAIADARSGDHITFDIRSGIPGQPDYPAVIHLQAPLVLDNDLTFDGPGADRLAISGDTNLDGTPDVQLFTVNAAVVMNRLGFTQGTADFAGGAFEVGEAGDLTLSYCTVSDCQAAVWGGGIDVDGGHLLLDHCLVRGNSTSAELGMGGGGLSLYTYQDCEILHTTFAENYQRAAGGLGGGAIYAETYDPGIEFDTLVFNCTFRGNQDEGGQGSAIRPNVFNTFLMLQNTIVADGQGKNIEMDQSGAVISLGGNISDDSTATIFSAGGTPLNTFIFHPPADQTNVDAAVLLADLADNSGPTATFALPAGSTAIGGSISNQPSAAFYSLLGTDQRGYFRDPSPDAGAFERGAGQRILIEEIGFNPAPPNTNDQFVEFYVPRDSAALDMGGFKVLVDGVARHTFTNQWLQPGEALVLFSKDAVNTGLPPGVHRQIAAANLQLNRESGLITLLNSSNQVVYQADYVGAFVSTDPNDYGYLSANYQSVVLSPQFQGVFLPYQRVVAKEGGADTNGLSAPGYDATGKPLTIGNAPPLAFDDLTATDAHTAIAAVSVLANDVDPDITDTLRVVGVGTGGNPGVSGATNFSTLGALLVINDSPTNGAGVTYDPTASAFIMSLPEGSNVVDTFQYTILDYSNSVPHVRGDTSEEVTQNLAKATATVTVNLIGVNSAPSPQDDSVTSNPVLTTPENVALDFTTADNILGNDYDVNTDDSSATLKIISICPTNGFVANVTNLTTALGAAVWLDIRFDRSETHLVYDPSGSAVLNALNAGESVDDTFYYTVEDSHGATSTAAIRIRVTGVNDGPTARADALATDEDTAATMPASFFLANDTDPDTTAALVVADVSPLSAAGAGVALAGTNLVYDPGVSPTLNALAQKESLVDTFTYTVADEWGLTSNATVSVTVAGVNDRPVAAPDLYAADEDSLFVAGASAGVLTNDLDVDAHDLIRVMPFSFATATNCDTAPDGGAPVVMSADGSFSLDARGAFDWLKQGEIYNDIFEYVVMDHSLSLAGDDQFAVTAGTSNNVLPVLANDSVLSGAGGAFGVVSLSAPDHGGTIAINAGQNGIIYTPAAGFVGVETFAYTNADGLGGTDWAKVTVTVAGSSLFALPDHYTVARGTTNVLGLLANDALIPATGASVSIIALGTPDHGGTVELNGAGPDNAVNYSPDPGASAPYLETFAYVIASGTLTATGEVIVAVLDRADALSLASGNDRFTVIAGSGNNVLDVLTNDVILPGTVSNLFITGFATNNLTGTVSLNAAHTRLLYKPGEGITNQAEILTYSFADGAGGTGSASAVVQVVPGGFFANDDNFYVYRNSSNALAVMVNDVILPNLGQTLFISGTGFGTNAPQHGTVTLNGPGTGLIYLPAAGYSGPDDFTYEISDGSPARALGHVHVSVLDNSAVPSNPDEYRVARESADNALAVLANDYPLPVTPGALTIVGLQSNGVHGAVAISGSSANNTLRYSPAAGFIGVDHFQYLFRDYYGNLGTNLVTVTVGDLAPRADEFYALSGSAGNVLDVRANDYPFPDTNALRQIHSLGAPDQGGSVMLNGDATAVLYTPSGGFTGTEHFSYQLADDTTNVFSADVTVNVRRAGSDRDTNSVLVAVVGVNDLPTIAVPANAINLTDKETVMPFTNVVIGDLDECGFQTNTVTVSLDDPAKGALVNLGGFAALVPGVYRMQGSPEIINASLQNLVFVPVENRIPVPDPEPATFTIAADDGYVASPSTNFVVVNVTPVNDAPVITGTVAGQVVYDHGSLRPFAGVRVTDVDNQATQALRCTISLDAAGKGVLTSLGGFVDLGGGVYAYGASNGVVTAAMITTALRGVVFTPTPGDRVTPGSPETTRFTLAVDDFFAPTVTDTNTTVVALDPLNASVTANDKLSGAQFGWSVATLRDVAVIGAPMDTLTNAGSAYLFARSLDGSNTWTQIRKLRAPDGKSLDHFGTGVALSGDLVVVGAPNAAGRTGFTGAAYVFARNQGGTNQWGFVKKLYAADGTLNDQFGSCVAISNTLVVVGAPNGAGAVSSAGAAYVYDRDQDGPDQWGQVRKLTATNGASGDAFATAVGISGDMVVVGGPKVDLPGANNGGAVFLFSRNLNGANQWGLSKRLTLANAAGGDQFGSAVSLGGDQLVAGAPYANQPGATNCGAAYVFARNQGGGDQWGLVQPLVLTNPAAADHFGSAVAIDGDAVVVGAPQRDQTGGADYGAVYLFKRNEGGSNAWGRVDRFLPSAVGPNDDFGCAVALSQGTVVAGAYNSLTIGQRYGMAFMFRIFYNNQPQLLLPIADQFLVEGAPFNFAMPAGAFADPDVDDVLAYQATGNPLPAWLGFDPLTVDFSGTPSASGSFEAGLVATDLYGASATNAFHITVYSTSQPGYNVLAAKVTGASGAGKVLQFDFTGIPNTGYRLQQTTNLVDAIWMDVTTVNADVNGSLSLSITNALPTAFYRMVTP